MTLVNETTSEPEIEEVTRLAIDVVRNPEFFTVLDGLPFEPLADQHWDNDPVGRFRQPFLDLLSREDQDDPEYAIQLVASVPEALADTLLTTVRSPIATK